MTQTKRQAAIETAKAVMMAVREVETPIENAKPIQTVPRIGGPTLKEPIFHWKAQDKYHYLCYFETEVKNTFLTNIYNMQESEKG